MSAPKPTWVQTLLQSLVRDPCVLSTGTIAFLDAVQSFDPSVRAPWPATSFKTLSQHLLSFLRRLSRLCRQQFAKLDSNKMKRRSGPKSRTSIYLGVTQYKRTGRWEAHIWESSESRQSKGRQLHLGSFPAAQPAALAYDRAAFKLRPYTSHFNFPDTDYTQDEFVKRYGRLDKYEFVQRLRNWAQSPELADEFDHPVTVKQAIKSEKQQQRSATPSAPSSPKAPLPLNRRARKPRNAVSYSQESEQTTRCVRPRRECGSALGGYSEGVEIKSPIKHFGVPQHILELNALAQTRPPLEQGFPGFQTNNACLLGSYPLQLQPVVPQPPQAMHYV